MIELDGGWAWRCEECRNWQLPETPAMLVTVNDTGKDKEYMLVVQQVRIMRRMVICPSCHLTMRVPG